ncbi:hypothetical protein ABBQ32_011201 [Trebouxia sp. C0010 RCD-2024]
MASPAPTGRGSRARKGKRTTDQAPLYEQELEGTKSRAASRSKAKSRSQAGASVSARRLAAPNADDLQYAAQQIQLYTANARADRQAQTLSTQEQEKLMRDVMRHMLFRQKALPNVPVPRNDLTKVILASYKDTKKDPKLGNAIIALAQEYFPKTIGMEMKELRVAPISKGKSKIADNETAGSKFYVLRSLVPRNWRKKFIVDDDQSPSRHLLIVLLMLIKCHGDKLAEGI